MTVTEPIEGGAPKVGHPSSLGGTRHLSAAQFVHDQRDATALVAYKFAVAAVLIDGEVRMRGREIPGVDVAILTRDLQAAGERMWRLPLHDDYKDGLKSDIADLNAAWERLDPWQDSVAGLAELGRNLQGGSNNEMSPPTEMVGEFKLQTGTLGAEFGGGQTAVGKRLAGRGHIYVDLHMHTSWSHDCLVEPEELVRAGSEDG
jgi:hypothetical protein